MKKEKTWIVSILLSIFLISSIVMVALFVEITKGLIVLAIAAIWILAISIKKSITEEKENENV